ncbi:hypothetical protein HRF87_21300 [Bacillus sp. CRN 9]|nr:hypothetical protein [Bacillus sp. CRN 9]
MKKNSIIIFYAARMGGKLKLHDFRWNHKGKAESTTIHHWGMKIVSLYSQ